MRTASSSTFQTSGFSIKRDLNKPLFTWCVHRLVPIRFGGRIWSLSWLKDSKVYRWFAGWRKKTRDKQYNTLVLMFFMLVSYCCFVAVESAVYWFAFCASLRDCNQGRMARLSPRVGKIRMFPIFPHFPVFSLMFPRFSSSFWSSELSSPTR